MSEPILTNAALSKLGELAREMADAPVSEDIHAEGRHRIMAAVHSEVVPRKVVPLRAKATLGVFAAAAAFALVFWSSTRVRPITYDIVGGSSFESGYLSASSKQEALVRFSDGSWINAAPGTHLRVDSTTTDGARVLLERGAAAVQVHHGKTSRWAFIAGPFEVQVVGTRFTLAWDPAKEEVDLSLEEGAVKIHSPLGQGPFVVRKGQKFHASLANKTIRMQDEGGVTSSAVDTSASAAAPPQDAPAENGQDNPAEAPQVPAAVDSAPANDSAGAVGNPPSSAVKPASTNRQESWQTLVSRGRFQAVVDAAEARGVENCLQSCSVSDVRALADAARYTGHAGIAESSLLAIRQRAPSGNQRSAAAFLLGRISESRGQVGAASRWYENYLAESPGG